MKTDGDARHQDAEIGGVSGNGGPPPTLFDRLMAIVAGFKRFEDLAHVDGVLDEAARGAAAGEIEIALVHALLTEIATRTQHKKKDVLMPRLRTFIAKHAPPPPSTDPRPKIYVGDGRFHEIVEETQAILERKAEDLFIHGHHLAVPTCIRAETADKQPIYPPAFAPVSVSSMSEYMSRHARFFETKVTQSGGVRDDYKLPSERVAKVILERRNTWKFRAVVGLSSCPTITRSGRIIRMAGYDSQSMLWLHNPPAVPDITDEMASEDQARRALRFLYKYVLVGFHFAQPRKLNRAVAISYLLSSVSRAALGPAPLHLTTAPEAGSGKSFLAGLAAAMLTGLDVAVVGATLDEKEFEKRLDAVLLEARQIVMLDNLSGEFESDKLCQILTQPKVDVRLFHTQQMPMMPPSGFWCANGNNVVLGGDLPRRTVHGRLDTGVEKPWLVEYRSDPMEFVKANRARCIQACLTILKAFIVKVRRGEAKPLRRLNGFGAWSDVVRSAIHWLTGQDIVDTIEGIRIDNPKIAQQRRFFEAWAAFVGCNVLVSSETLVEKLGLDKGMPYEPGETPRANFERALRTMTNDRLGTVSVGRVLGRLTGKVSGEYCFSPEQKTIDGYRQWYLIRNEAGNRSKGGADLDGREGLFDDDSEGNEKQ